MKHHIIVLLLIYFMFFPLNASANDFDDFSEIDLESILNTEVVSASRRAEKLHQAPNAMYVITENDIKYSGAVDLPDVFRMVPGVDVVNVYGNSYGVSSRGLNQHFPQQMLVLIDGRSIYTTFFGGVFWENEEVFLEDIKRIEIIRGPGASIWGANATNGVINIITKDPEEDQAIMTTVKAGTKKFREGIFRYSDRISEKLSVSLTGGYREDEGTRETKDFRRIPKVTGRLKYKIADNSILHFFAGANESELGLDVTEFSTRTDSIMRNNYQMLRWEHGFSETSQLQFQVYKSGAEVHSEDNQILIDEDKIDIELHHSFALGQKIRMIWGANYRNTEVDSSLLRSSNSHDDLVGLFLQNDIEIASTVKLVTGLRYEHNSFTGSSWSPRACLMYSPADDHHFRLSVSRAYRTPSFFDDDVNVPLTLPPNTFPSITIGSVRGNDDLDPERMTAFELGYRTVLGSKVALNVELYYNDLENVIGSVVQSSSFPIRLSLDNDAHIISKGIEIAVDYPVTSWWMLKANYTFQEVEYKRINTDVSGSPKHKFNLGSNMFFQNGFSFNANLHYVDETRWGSIPVDDYIRIDVRVSQKLFKDRVELSLAGQNLTDKLHEETADAVGTYKVERLLYGQITYYFK